MSLTPALDLILRNPPFSPLDLSPVLWLDAQLSPLFQNSNGTTAATADGDPVGYWGDLSGGGRNAIQATAGNRPLLKLAIQNGLSVIRFDGNNDSLAATLTAVTQPYTLFIVAKQTDKGTAGRFLDSVNVARALFGLKATTGLSEMFSGSLLSGAVDRSGAFHQWSVLYNGAASLARMDGASDIAAGDAGSESLADPIVGNDNGSADLNGDVAMIVLCSGNKTADFSRMEAYAKSRWGTP